MADPGFHRQEAPNPEIEAKTYHLAIFFAENCMKMKEIGLRGEHASLE